MTYYNYYNNYNNNNRVINEQQISFYSNRCGVVVLKRTVLSLL